MTSPLFSIVIPVWNPDINEFNEAIDSIFAQREPEWQLVLVADGPQPTEVQAVLEDAVERAQGQELREVLVVQREKQGGIVAATNDGMEVASGEFVAFMDNDDVLASRALSEFRLAIEAHDDVDVVYSDEDKIDLAGNRNGPFFKPGWSPERLRSHNFLTHLSCYRRSLIAEVGNLRSEFDGSQDHDLALRVTEKARRISHVPQVLYHWRQSLTSVAYDPANKDWAFEAGIRAVQSHLDRLNIPAIAERDYERSGIITNRPVLTEFPLVSIVMLSGGARRVVRGEDIHLVTNAISSIVSTSTYPNYEIVVVLDCKSTDKLEAEVREAGPGKVRVVRDDRPFNFSYASNLGASYAYGDQLLFLNDDTEVLTQDWIERMVMFSERPGVGAVGARLEYADGRIQHAGIKTRSGLPTNLYPGHHETTLGQMGALWLSVNTLAVTAACLMVKRSAFDAVGGFCTELPLNFNDVDFCLKLIDAGYRNVVDNRTRLIHHETSSRVPGLEDWESEFLRSRWSKVLDDNPWDNPNLADEVTSELGPHVALLQRQELEGRARFGARSWSRSDAVTD